MPYADTKPPAAAIDAPIAEPSRRPIRRISIAANTVAAAVPSTITDCGSVASDGFGDNVVPMIPPTITISTVPLPAIVCAVSRMKRLRLHMGVHDSRASDCDDEYRSRGDEP